jgi:DHA2 family multidrug resistance protein
MIPLSAAQRGWVTASLMIGMFMISIDSMVVNVALPTMQASLSASTEQITWVVTAYILGSAIMTPVAGWLATRIGMRPVLFGCIAVFTGVSLLCGIATNLPEMVLFRTLQGLAGAPLMPLSQAVLLNINPPERFGRAMALFTMAGVASPIIGPILGAYITDQLSWRWCFYINLPFGLVAMAIMWRYMPSQATRGRRFDGLGYASLALALASLQLLLDRGPSQDWFGSAEIATEAIVSGSAFWIYLTHTLTAKDPLFHPDLMRDRNFVTATALAFFASMLFIASMTLLPLMMQTLMGYSIITTGLFSMPRGITMMIALQVMGRLDAAMDRRILIGAGFLLIFLSYWQMSHFDLSMDPRPILVSGTVQALGMALVTVPLTTLAMGTLRADLRPEASAVGNLVRSLGGAVGISGMQALIATNSQRMHASLAQHIRLDDPVVRASLPPALWPSSHEGALRLEAEVSRQAGMIAYVDDFVIMMVVALVVAPLILLLRESKSRSAPVPVEPHVA